MKKVICLLLAAVLPAVFISSCKAKQKKYSATKIMMTTVVTVTLYGGSEEILEGAIGLCESYEKLFSRTVPSSDISNINESGGAATAVSPDTAELINKGLEISLRSGGAFDITVLPLSLLWDVQHSAAPPDDASVKDALKTVGFENVSVNGNEVTLKNDASIDLGGIAKGYIADKVAEYLRSEGVKSAVINLGGNVVVLGEKSGKPYTVGIQKPFAGQGEAMLTLALSDKTAVTSGIYERYFEYDGKIYHHIIDPATGKPSESDVASVTVICDSSCIADGLSTACLVLGMEKSAELLKSYGAEAVFINRNSEYSVTDGLTVDTTGTLPMIALK